MPKAVARRAVRVKKPTVLLTVSLAVLALLSLALTVWQFVVALRFPLHQRVMDTTFAPAVTLLKPLKERDAETSECLRSWLTQDYGGPVQVLFGVAKADDPVCETVRELIAAHPRCDAQLVVCSESLGANAKVSTLVQLDRLARHDFLVVSDADMRVPADFLANAMAPFASSSFSSSSSSSKKNRGKIEDENEDDDEDENDAQVGLVNCFYCLANPSTLPTRWEAIAVNADFWSQVLQSRSLKPLDFALGAVMAVPREALDAIGGFKPLLDFLADDYQLGHLIADTGRRIELCPVVVECCEAPMTWRRVWTHQLRWSRTIRVCQPLPFFFSILSNATLWPVLLLLFGGKEPRWKSWLSAGMGENYDMFWIGFDWRAALVFVCLLARVFSALLLQKRLTRSVAHFGTWWLAPVKDLLGVAIWALAFIGNKVTWRGVTYRVRPGGRLVKIDADTLPR